MFKVLVLTLAATNLLAQAGGYASRPQVRVLANWSQKAIEVPAFNEIESRCDQDGNLYFHLDTGSYNDVEVLYLSADGRHGHKFTLSETSQKEKPHFQNLAVSPSGELYVLTLLIPEYQVLTFDNDGVSRNPVSLRVPDHVNNDKFLAFDDGTTLFRGFYNADAPPKLRGKSYTALFEASGKLRKELTTGVNEELRSTDEIGDLRDGDVATGEDGNAYVLSLNRITVVSESGELVRRFSVEKPDPKALAYKIYISGGTIALVLKYMEGARVTRDDFLLIDATTGEQFGLYEAPPEIEAFDVCYLRPEGFTFLHRDKGQQTLIKVPLN